MKVSASIDFSRFVYTWHNARQCCQIGESRPKSTEKDMQVILKLTKVEKL